MYSNAKAGDTALRRIEFRLYSAGLSHIEVAVAVPHEIERVTATRVVIFGRQYQKDTGYEFGGKGRLVHPDNPPDKYDNQLEIMTWEQIDQVKKDFERFNAAFRFVHTHPKVTQYCVYRAFKDKSLRQGILLREEQFRNAIHESLEAYNVEIEMGR